MTAVTLFDQPVQLPAYLQTSAVAKALAEQIDGGLAGKSINRISLRNGKFRFVRGGVEVGVHRAQTLDVVIIAANPHVGRQFYIKPFDSDDTGQRPDCYSVDGRAPAEDSPARQSATCALCPQNVMGSAKNGQGRACSFKKRLVVTSHDAIGGEAFAIDVAGMGLFGDDDPPQKLFNLKSYIEALKANHLIVPAVVTRLSFDDEASVPKLFFTPVRVLSAEEFAAVEGRLADPTVREMLTDVDNKTEEGKPVGAPLLPQPTATPAPATPAPAAPAAPAAQPAPPSTRRGRKAASQIAPAAAPAPSMGGVAPGGPPPAMGGFGMSPTPPMAQAPAAAPAATAAPATGFSLDLDAFDA